MLACLTHDHLETDALSAVADVRVGAPAQRVVADARNLPATPHRETSEAKARTRSRNNGLGTYVVRLRVRVVDLIDPHPALAPV
eukprot:COSAG06_NODE_146_length_22145_cov_11.714733_2_plen_84_part_00